MKILITGGSGMVGQALRRLDFGEGYELVFINGRIEYDLACKRHVELMFKFHQPDVVIHLAARVGGILDNVKYPYDYILENTMINLNVLEACRQYQVSRMIAMLSTCIYPDAVQSHQYPMLESRIHQGPPTPTNFSYAYAKRMMAVAIDASNKQFGTKYSYIIPSNLYGPNDKFDNSAHFVGALIRKIWTAKQRGEDHIGLLGTGNPLRQFMFVDDLAMIIRFCVQNDLYYNFNVAPDEEYSINEIAEKAFKACDWPQGRVIYDDKLDGQYRKTVSNQHLKFLIPGIEFTPLILGLKRTWDWYNEAIGKSITLG